ncbi:AI-2E family transporter [bacterium]|nr:AI-2E family transporter [bacterium]
MNKQKIIGILVGLLLLFVAFYWLSDLIVYTLVAFLISMLGRPMVKLFHNRFKFPKTLASITSLVVIIGVLSLIVWLVFPLFLRQVNQLAEIDYSQVLANTSASVDRLLAWLSEKGIEITQEEVSAYVSSVVNQIWNSIHIEGILIGITGSISSLSIGIFSVLFISFFFLRDEQLFRKILFLFIPDRYETRMGNVLNSSERLLNRYFVGISLEVLCMMTLLSLGLWAMGIDNALLYGCMGGFLNIIPYLGPVIGAVLTCLFTIFTNIEAGFTVELFWMIVKVVGVFVACNLIDNFVLQVSIYSTSVMAHPLEIFFVILIAGTLGGIWGMILAIPSYTVLRIVGKEFFKDTKLVRELTRRI